MYSLIREVVWDYFMLRIPLGVEEKYMFILRLFLPPLFHYNVDVTYMNGSLPA
ncbi:hypothetical protein [Vulcanisaeta distributa]|uniref:hypothetical protein n=1 Tax=Vulcanisaeta distributa TaxID=164451 RepID=UPI000B0480F5|nr:hypothetical protein [Vulcanisaeta distributa]